MCLPPLEVIVRHLKRVIRTGNDVRSVFVASDGNHMLDELGKALARMKVRAVVLFFYGIDAGSLHFAQRSYIAFADTGVPARAASVASFGSGDSRTGELLHR